jgi:uncharacterized membrane protein
MTKRMKMMLVSVAVAVLVALGAGTAVAGLVADEAACSSATEIAGRFGGGYS